MHFKHYIFCCLLLGLLACKTNKTYITELDYTRIDLEPSFPSESEIEKIIAPYKEKLGNEMDEILAQNEQDLRKQKPNSFLGNWFTDILHEQGEKLTNLEIDFAAQNHGGFRIPVVPKGPIPVGKIYELMPFDNTLIILELDGSTTKKLIDRIADYGGWPISKGLSFVLDDGKASNILINGKALDLQGTYTIALPDYVANGGDDCEFLKGQKAINTGVFIRDVVINYLRQFPSSDNITVDKTKRIIIN